jgi:hypothetical protein
MKGLARCKSYTIRDGVSIGSLSNMHRFVSSPIPVVNKRLNAETAELKSDISALSKKLHYLETTNKNSREHMDQIFKSQGRS